MPEIIIAGPEHTSAIADLLLEYANDLDADAAICIETLEQELAGLGRDDGIYAPPHGRFLLALDDGEIAGGVGLLGSRTAELRRLYVRPAFRGRQIGRWLAMAATHEARQAGCKSIRLETTPGMAAAQKLYESMGFIEVPADRPGPIRTMQLELS